MHVRVSCLDLLLLKSVHLFVVSLLQFLSLDVSRLAALTSCHFNYFFFALLETFLQTTVTVQRTGTAFVWPLC